MSRVVVYTDDFNRSNRVLGGDTGGSPATVWDGSYIGRDGHQIVTNKIRARGDLGVPALSVSRAVLDADQYAKVKLFTFEASGDWIGAVVRCANEPITSHYMVLARSGGGNTQLYRVDNGVLTSLGLVADPGWVVGDTVELEAIGTTLTVFRNGTPIGLSATDATYAVGRVGIISAVPLGLQGNMEADDFEAGNVIPDEPPGEEEAPGAGAGRHHRIAIPLGLGL